MADTSNHCPECERMGRELAELRQQNAILMAEASRLERELKETTKGLDNDHAN